jgi:hypothetical protein
LIGYIKKKRNKTLQNQQESNNKMPGINFSFIIGSKQMNEIGKEFFHKSKDNKEINNHLFRFQFIPKCTPKKKVRSRNLQTLVIIESGKSRLNGTTLSLGSRRGGTTN